MHARWGDLQGANALDVKWTELKQRPYLWAIIHESARIARHEDSVYASKSRVKDKNIREEYDDGSVECFIPRVIPLGMTSMINHKNEKLFPKPDDDKPNFK